ncbi:hypothetical protein LCGC14_0413340 [marine sediment metagenome]|uniref:Terminase large subunit gp17-like C-terminal domain-containing protein n=1 Tax=marine sediment metagenome TaxID=412755 RepID=A0A0F9TB59_9ZZZZ
MAEVHDRARRQVALRVQVARGNVNEFCELVLKDEQTGQPIEQASIHEEWHQLAEENDRVILWSFTEGGKTQQLSIARTLHALGRDTSTRVAIISNTHEQASKVIRAVAHFIEKSEDLRVVFPDLKKSEPWTGHHLYIDRLFRAKDPSVQACGVHGAIVGSRIDLLILDDILDYENCQTVAARQDLWDWYHSALASRLTDRARVLIIGTAFHPEDLLHRLAGNPAWIAKRFPVISDAGVSAWPEKWSASRIQRRREELGPLEFSRQMLCKARDESQARFQREWIDRCIAEGSGMRLVRSLAEFEQLDPELHKMVQDGECSTYTGVDLAVQRHSAAGLTVLFTILVDPDDCRQVLAIEAGRWSGPDIVRRIVGAHQRFNSVVVVENNAAQDFVLQFAREASAVPIMPFTTGRNKAHPEFGIESLAAEMAGGKWLIPNDGGKLDPEVEAWISEMLYYDPRSHTGDRLMGCWFSREGARLGGHNCAVNARIIG